MSPEGDSPQSDVIAEHDEGRKPKSGTIALVLGIVAPGLGHLYSARPSQAFVALGVYLALLLPGAIVLPMVLSLSLTLVILSHAFSIMLLLAVPVSGAIVARRTPRTVRTRWNRVWVYAAFLIVAGLLMSGSLELIRMSSPLRRFGIPTQAMIPTLLVGDVAVADMRSSATERLSRGDVVVFESPDRAEVLYAKRIIGLPGETLEIRNRQVLIDGRALDEPYKVHETDLNAEQWGRIREGYSVVYGADETGQDARGQRRLLGGMFDFGPYRVPAGHYFLMGDNRDNSKDSRAFGPVSGESIQGEMTRINWSAREAFWDIRWHRLGKRIE